MRHFRVHSQSQGLHTSFLMTGWMRLFPGPLGYGVGDRTKAKRRCSQVLMAMECFQVYSWGFSQYVSYLSVNLTFLNSTPSSWTVLSFIDSLLPGSPNSHKVTFVHG